MASASEKTSKLDNTGTEQLKCAICLDVYNNLRVLNCLHSFCEPCIQSLVTKGQDKMAQSTGILCPLCRTETLSPCPNTPLTEWVKQLPLSTSILPLLEIHGHEANKVKYCTVCKTFNKTTCAQYFCKECDQFQCENCTLWHSQFPATKSHQVVNIDEQSAEIADKLILGKLEYCPQHPDREVELYCDDDNKFCCFECLFLYHRSCKQIDKVVQLGQTLKEGDRSQELENHMDTIQKQIGDIVGELKKASSTIENQAVEIPQRIREIRDKIVRVLDQLVSDITAECGQLKKQHTMELDDKITSMQCLEAAVTTSRSLLDTLMKHGTTKQVYIVIQKLEEQTSEYSTQVTAAQKSMDTVQLSLSVSDDLNKINQTTQVLARVTATHPQCKTTQISNQITARQSKQRDNMEDYQRELVEERILGEKWIGKEMPISGMERKREEGWIKGEKWIGEEMPVSGLERKREKGRIKGEKWIGEEMPISGRELKREKGRIKGVKWIGEEKRLSGMERRREEKIIW